MESLSNYENIDKSSSKLLAWCSQTGNKISVTELDGKQEEYANFEGVQLLNKGINRYGTLPKHYFYVNYEDLYNNSWTHVKEISGTKLLISLHHNCSKSANIEVFNLVNKGRSKKIYSLSEIIGCKFFTKNKLLSSLLTYSTVKLRIIITYCNRYGNRRSHL